MKLALFAAGAVLLTQLKVGHWTFWHGPGMIDEKMSGNDEHGVLVVH